jgi:alpha-L-rhamnosidase
MPQIPFAMKCLSLALFLLLSAHLTVGQVTVSHLLTEHRTDPVGLDVLTPRFSWQLAADKTTPDRRNIRQTAYEIRVGLRSVGLRSVGPRSVGAGVAPVTKEVVWQSGRIESGQSVGVPYGGAALLPNQGYAWQVRVWDESGKPSAWSSPATWLTGLLTATNWKAQWIQPALPEDTTQPSPLLRKTFAAAKTVRSATLFITAHGLYEAQLNGQRVGDAYLTPGWTSYPKHLQYQTYDVTGLVKTGPNALGVTLGSGWFRGRLAWEKQKNIYGPTLALLAQLHLTYTDGTTDTVVSDGSWKAATGPVRAAEIYDGEVYDARLEKTNWTQPGYNDTDWAGVTTATFGYDNLVAAYNEPIRKHETRQPIKVLTTPTGKQVLDFGQNMVGWVQVRATGKAGDKLLLSHTEMLDKAGNPYFANLRTAKAQATYILKGGAPETLEPHFTFFGFRYVQVEGLTGPLNPADFTAVALYSDMPRTGEFSCSSPLVNQLQSNIQWSQRGNFLDVPTDCPQRDERLGWTGDAEVFSRTAAFNFGVNNFFAKWLLDVTADQATNGAIPFVIPDVLSQNQTINRLAPEPTGAAGWSDAGIIIPWNMYVVYADRRIIETQYPGMKAYLNYMRGKAKNDLWNTGFQFGDWLSYRVDDSKGMIGQKSAVTDNYLVAQCFYAYCADLMTKSARLLGNTDDAADYEALAQRIREAFRREYTTSSGRLISDTQTAYVLALQFDMLPEASRPAAVARLVENVKRYDYHLTTGFLGTPFLTPVLSRFGHIDAAYKLLLQETYPSWLYPVKMGATTIWERWDSMKPDGSFQDPSMTSFNHYAYGAVGDWLYRTVAGIDTDEAGPGYSRIVIRPQPGDGLTSASASLQTYYGTVRSDWKIAAGTLTLTVEIPANTTATVYVPATNAATVQESGKSLLASGLTVDGGSTPGVVKLAVGSGVYRFEVKN